MIVGGKKHGLLSHILWRVLPAIIAVQLAIGWISSERIDRVVSTELQSHLSQAAEQYSQTMALKLRGIIETAALIAQNDLIINGLVDAQEREHYIPVFIESAQIAGSTDEEITLLDYRGRIVASNRQTENYTDAVWLDTVLSGNAYQNLSDDGFVVAQPVKISGGTEGIVLVQIAREHLPHTIGIPTTVAEVVLIYGGQHVLFSSDPDLERHFVSGATANTSDWQVEARDISGFHDLILLTGERRSVAFAVVDRVRYFLFATMLTSIGAVVIAIVAAGLLGSRPINRLAKKIEKIGGFSDLDLRIQAEGTLETLNLANAFNKMLFKLKETTASRDDLTRTNEDLRRSNDDLEKFAYVASHDLRSPLKAMHDLASWTLEDAADELSSENRANLETLVQRINRLDRLLQDLLNYAQTGSQNSEFEAVNFDEFVGDILEICDPDKKFEVAVTSDQTKVSLPVTPARQILINLIGNAIKHHDEPSGLLKIAATQSGTRTEFRVSDNGPGIEPAYHSKIFEVFQTLKSRDEVEGSGMGLAIIAKLVDAHDGKIHVRSQPAMQRGTTFAFDLPSAPSNGALHHRRRNSRTQQY